MSKKQFKLAKPHLIIESSPFAKLFPEHAECCAPENVELLHRHYCKILGVSEILDSLTWRFEKRFRATLGQAEYWDDENTGEMKYLIRYATNFWVPMGAAGRRNLIAHEICHLAVEKIFGHGNTIEGIKVTDHGYHWKLLMFACDEDPNLDTGC